MKLSIVATLYQSSSYIAEFYQRACACARHVAGEDFEIVLVNDGSPDDSLSWQSSFQKMTITLS